MAGFFRLGAHAKFIPYPVTGTIARTATKVRAGAHGPIAGILHAAFLRVFMLAFAPLAGVLAGVLAVVAWNMIEKVEAWMLVRVSSGDAPVLGVTFPLVIFRDLAEAVLVGFVPGIVRFIERMSKAAHVEERAPLAAEDRAGAISPYGTGAATDSEVLVYRIKGAFLFGTASTMGSVLDRIADRPRTFVLDLAEVPFLESTAAHAGQRTLAAATAAPAESPGS